MAKSSVARDAELAGALADLLPYAEGVLANLVIGRDTPEVKLLEKRVQNARRLLFAEFRCMTHDMELRDLEKLTREGKL